MGIFGFWAAGISAILIIRSTHFVRFLPRKSSFIFTDSWKRKHQNYFSHSNKSNLRLCESWRGLQFGENQNCLLPSNRMQFSWEIFRKNITNQKKSHGYFWKDVNWNEGGDFDFFNFGIRHLFSQDFWFLHDFFRSRDIFYFSLPSKLMNTVQVKNFRSSKKKQSRPCWKGNRICSRWNIWDSKFPRKSFRIVLRLHSK